MPAAFDIKKWAAKRREIRASLAPQFPDGYCYVVSKDTLNSKAGAMHEVAIEDAAALLADDSHRLATEAEVKAYVERNDAERARLMSAQVEAARAQFNAIMGAAIAPTMPPPAPAAPARK